MWKITTRGCTLQEVLIMAAMNIATAVIAAEKRGQRASQDSTRRDIYAIWKLHKAGTGKRCGRCSITVHDCNRARNSIRGKSNDKLRLKPCLAHLICVGGLKL